MGTFHFDRVFFFFFERSVQRLEFHSVFHDLFCSLIIFSVIGGGGYFLHPGLRNLGAVIVASLLWGTAKKPAAPVTWSQCQFHSPK